MPRRRARHSQRRERTVALDGGADRQVDGEHDPKGVNLSDVGGPKIAIVTSFLLFQPGNFILNCRHIKQKKVYQHSIEKQGLIPDCG